MGAKVFPPDDGLQIRRCSENRRVADCGGIAESRALPFQAWIGVRWYRSSHHRKCRKEVLG